MACDGARSAIEARGHRLGSRDAARHATKAATIAELPAIGDRRRRHLRYLQEARPRCAQRAVFLTIKAPFRPLSGASIGAMVRMRLRPQGVKLNQNGAHCLRHVCAGQLLDADFTLKQIADHLGHRSMNTTRIYTKIDLRGLREVAELDLGDLL